MAVRFLLERTVKSGFVKPKLGFGVFMDHYAGMSSLCCKNWNPFAHTDPCFFDCPLECPKDMDLRYSVGSGIAPYKGPLDHPKIIRPARIAVEQYNQQQNAQLEFVRLLKAYTQLSVGTKFCLTLEAIDAAGVKNTYFAEILRNASNNCIMELESFRLVPDYIKT